MPEYWYQALTGSGAVEEGWISAGSEILVEEQLRRNGSFLIKAEPRTRTRKVTDANIDRKELLAFLEYLSGSFVAGIPLLTAPDDVPRRLLSHKFKAIVNVIRFAVAFEGTPPGVLGSPGPSERNWTDPRWMPDGGRMGPSG